MSYLVADASNNTAAHTDMAQLRTEGVHAVILKASEGLGYHDPTYDGLRIAARKAKLITGAYGFCHVGQDSPEAEADFFLACARPIAGDLLPCGDFEFGGAGDQSAWIARYLSRVATNLRARGLVCDPTTGAWTLSYSGQWWWAPHTNGHAPAHSLAWIAAYQGSAPSAMRGFPINQGWQFTDHWQGRAQDMSHFTRLPLLVAAPSKTKTKAAAGAAAVAVAAGGGAATAGHTTTKTVPAPAPHATSIPTPSPAKTTTPPAVSTKARDAARVSLGHAQGNLHVKTTGQPNGATSVALRAVIADKHGPQEIHAVTGHTGGKWTHARAVARLGVLHHIQSLIRQPHTNTWTRADTVAWADLLKETR